MMTRILDLVNGLFAMPRAALLLLAACLGALGTAFIAQYQYGLEPCILCIWQRIPFALAVFFAGLAVMARNLPDKARTFLLLVAAVMLVNTGLSVFHTGVEQHWWAGTADCAATPVEGAVTPETMRAALLATEIARCDEITWTFLGFSMANWNIPFTFGLALFAFLAAHCLKTGRPLLCDRRETHPKPH